MPRYEPGNAHNIAFHDRLVSNQDNAENVRQMRCQGGECRVKSLSIFVSPGLLELPFPLEATAVEYFHLVSS